MTSANPGPRPRGPPSGRGPPSASSTAGNGRPPPITVNGGSQASGGSMSRAEKFEDEKRRIIESCFGKKEPDGSVAESYITHIRILEDAAHPSSPPPVQSPQENKKPRIIVIAVRKSGRVRMHKARENNNGSFSIGKTWVLDDLSAIQSYNNIMPGTAEEQQAKERALDIGFIVTIQKPYYWQASTAKEKDFFIYSLIKIYKKYTAGNLPQLIGFDPQELEQFGGASSLPPNATSPRPPYTPAIPNTPSSANLNGRPSPGPSLGGIERPLMTPQLDQKRDVDREPRQRPSHERSIPTDSESFSRPSQDRSQRTESESRSRPSQDSSSRAESEQRSRPSQERVLRNTDSDDRMPYVPGQFPSSDFVRNLKPQSPQPQMPSQRSDSPSSRIGPFMQPDSDLRKLATAQSTESFRNAPERQAYRYQTSRQHSEERTRLNGVVGLDKRSESSDSMRPATSDRSQLANGIHGDQQRLQDRVQDHRIGANGSTLTPILSPGLRSNESREPSRSNEGNSRDQMNTTYGEQAQVSAPQKESSIQASLDNAAVPDISSSLSNIENDTPTTSLPPTSLPVPPEPLNDTELHRPGLGPMIKSKKSNKEIAATFRSAAKSYNAFKPRAGGAAEKLRDNREGFGNEPDGITGVVPAPSLLARQQSQAQIRSPTPDQAPASQPSTPMPINQFSPPSVPDESHSVSQTGAAQQPKRPPAVRISTPPDQRPGTAEGLKEGNAERVDTSPEKPQDERRRKRKLDHSAKYAKALGITPSLLEGRTFEIESVLNDFGWGEESGERNTLEELQSGIRKELARVEAGSWLGSIENNDERIAAVGNMMDRVVAECEEFDCLLTLYNVELGTLSEDVAYIEAQSQGLQVQTANQKLLQTELKSLLNTISISASDLKILKDASLTKTPGIEAVEATLTQLYTAMITIDPRLRHNGQRSGNNENLHVERRASGGGLGGTEWSSMRAVREKKEGYQTESIDFIQRLKQYLSVKFREMEAETLDALEANRRGSTSKNPTKLDPRLRERPKRDLWQYSPLILFSREIDPVAWEAMMEMYDSCSIKPYKDEFRNNIGAWRNIARTSAGDEHDVLFTSQEKEDSGIVGRKLTVKRNKTVRGDGSGRISSNEKPQDGKVNAYEAFAGALFELTGVMFQEQNSLVDLFHVSSLENAEFTDVVLTPPESRREGNLAEKKLFDPDRAMARKVYTRMEKIYDSFPADLWTMVEWATKQDKLQGIGVLLSIESRLAELEETNQEFLIAALTKIHDRLVAKFTRFVDEQIRGIEDTKVKIKKRKGVIAFTRTFPNFANAIENMIPPTPIVATLPIRTHLNEAYGKINKAMFESLKVIANEMPSAIVQSGADPEDKEALNYHILLIENMNHYIEDVPVRGNPVLEEWQDRAVAEMSEHMGLYLSSVIRRPLGKLLDSVESMESLLNDLPAGEPATGIATQPSHGRSAFKKILSGHDGKEIRRGIETLKKRIEKHFGDEDVGGNRALVPKVMKECEGRYLNILERVQRIVAEVYEGSLEVEWRREEITGAFRR